MVGSEDGSHFRLGQGALSSPLLFSLGHAIFKATKAFTSVFTSIGISCTHSGCILLGQRLASHDCALGSVTKASVSTKHDTVSLSSVYVHISYMVQQVHRPAHSEDAQDGSAPAVDHGRNRRLATRAAHIAQYWE